MQFHGSSVYVNTFNPALLDADLLPTQRAPECPHLTKMLIAVKEGVLQPEMINWGMVCMHDMAKSPDDASTMTSTFSRKCPPVTSIGPIFTQ
jgi:hypothetical protein